MDYKSDTTRSMERKANTIKRLVINLLKLFRFCGKKKHESAQNSPEKAQNVQTKQPLRSDLIIWDGSGGHAQRKLSVLSTERI